MPEITFSSITECPDVRETVARWLWSFWGNPNNYGFYHSLVAHARPYGLPMVYVAFVDGKPAGTVALLGADLFSRQDLFPWMADLYVPPEYRSRGIGSALQDYIVKRARGLGFDAIYLYTPLVGYYEKSGWGYMGEEQDRDGTTVRIYKKDIV